VGERNWLATVCVSADEKGVRRDGEREEWSCGEKERAITQKRRSCLGAAANVRPLIYAAHHIIVECLVRAFQSASSTTTTHPFISHCFSLSLPVSQRDAQLEGENWRCVLSALWLDQDAYHDPRCTE